MHKKFLPILFFAFSSFVASAQIPTLTSSSNPEVGDWQLIYTTDSFDISTTGAGVTWNFSTLPINATDTTYASACSASPYCSGFPGTSIYGHQEGSTSSIYYSTSSTVCSVVGEYSTGAIAYSDYEDFLRFPFTYSSTFVDTFAATYVSGGYTYNRSGTITVTADGYGTLVLPNGTYTNALRIHRTENYSDSTSFSGIPFGYGYVSEIYTWYVPNARQVLLSQTQLAIDGSPTPSTAFYTNQTPGTIPSAVNTIQPLSRTLALFPNPATDELNIKFSTGDNERIRISLCDLLGREVAVIANDTYSNGVQQISYPTTSLPKGMYLIRIQTNDENITKKMELL